VEAMLEATCTRLDDNHYLFHYANEVTDALNAELKTYFGKRVMSLSDIHKSLSETNNILMATKNWVCLLENRSDKVSINQRCE